MILYQEWTRYSEKVQIHQSDYEMRIQILLSAVSLPFVSHKDLNGFLRKPSQPDREDKMTKLN